MFWFLFPTFGLGWFAWRMWVAALLAVNSVAIINTRHWFEYVEYEEVAWWRRLLRRFVVIAQFVRWLRLPIAVANLITVALMVGYGAFFGALDLIGVFMPVIVVGVIIAVGYGVYKAWNMYRRETPNDTEFAWPP